MSASQLFDFWESNLQCCAGLMRICVEGLLLRIFGLKLFVFGFVIIYVCLVAEKIVECTAEGCNMRLS